MSGVGTGVDAAGVGLVIQVGARAGVGFSVGAATMSAAEVGASVVFVGGCVA